MDFSAYNILKADHVLHEMPRVGYNYKSVQTGARMWCTSQGGIPIAASHCALEHEARDYLFPFFIKHDYCPIAVKSSKNEKGYWFPEYWEIKNTNFNDIPNTGIAAYDKPKSHYVGQHFMATKKDTLRGKLGWTPWLDIMDLSELGNQDANVEKIQLKLVIYPYCMRMGVMQNCSFHHGENTFFWGRGCANEIWHSPRKLENIPPADRKAMVDSATMRPYKPPRYGVVSYPADDSYTDWTWIPLKQWKGGSKSYINEMRNDIFTTSRDNLIDNEVDVLFLYQLPDIYWAISDDLPEHWSWDTWSRTLLQDHSNSPLPDYSGGWGLWDSEPFYKGWNDYDSFFRTFPEKTAVDVKVEVLTYKWRILRKVWDTDNNKALEADIMTNHNYFNARMWTSIRQLAPCRGVNSD